MIKLLRVLLDTNEYSTIFEQQKISTLRESALHGTVAFYGFSLIRKELRAISKNIRVDNQNFRNRLLEYYDLLVGNHTYILDRRIEETANAYAQEYHGGISAKKLQNDFLIVACASIHSIDVIVTEDLHSMASPLARQAYEKNK